MPKNNFLFCIKKTASTTVIHEQDTICNGSSNEDFYETNSESDYTMATSRVANWVQSMAKGSDSHSSQSTLFYNMNQPRKHMQLPVKIHRRGNLVNAIAPNSGRQLRSDQFYEHDVSLLLPARPERHSMDVLKSDAFYPTQSTVYNNTMQQTWTVGSKPNQHMRAKNAGTMDRNPIEDDYGQIYVLASSHLSTANVQSSVTSMITESGHLLSYLPNLSATNEANRRCNLRNSSLRLSRDRHSRRSAVEYSRQKDFTVLCTHDEEQLKVYIVHINANNDVPCSNKLDGLKDQIEEMVARERTVTTTESNDRGRTLREHSMVSVDGHDDADDHFTSVSQQIKFIDESSCSESVDIDHIDRERDLVKYLRMETQRINPRRDGNCTAERAYFGNTPVHNSRIPESSNHNQVREDSRFYFTHDCKPLTVKNVALHNTSNTI